MYENIYFDVVDYDVLRLRKKEVCKFQKNLDFMLFSH